MNPATIHDALLRRILSHPTGRWVFLGGCVGLLCGCASALFEIATDLVAHALLEGIAGLPPLIASGRPGALTSDISVLALLLIMTGGGLLAGLIIFRWSTAARGGGTGVAVHAFHHDRGVIPLSIPWTKFAASIISLGTGGSGGREGPISLIGAGFGSWFAGRIKLSARDRRILLAAGIAGGIAAVFRAPLAAVIFAAEVLYRGPELEAEVIIPGFISAAIGYLVDSYALDILGPLLGHTGAVASTLFQPGPVAFHAADWMQLAGYTLVAIAAAVVSRWFIATQQRAVRGFDRIRLPFWAKPGLGALATGAMAMAIFLSMALVLGSRDDARITLGTIGGGYGVLHWLFSGATGGHHQAVLAAMLAVIALGKCVTTSLTVGSGGSAGLFGPSIVIGGCAGGAVGYALAGLPIAPPPTACVLVGMAGVLASTHRTPIAALLMVSEIAGTWLLLLPTMWVCGIAFMLTGRRSLIGGQVDSLQDSPAHRSHLFSDVLAGTTVQDVMHRRDQWTTIPAHADIATCRSLVLGSAQEVFPVLRKDGSFAGVITRAELIRLEPDPQAPTLLLADDLAESAGLALRPVDSLAQALRRIHQMRSDEWVVADRDGRYLGMVCSAVIMDEYRAAIERNETMRREDGWARASTDGAEAGISEYAKV